MSAFWQYFTKLCWPQSFAPGPLQALARGLADHLDTAREDMPYLREQFFPTLCAPELMSDHGTSRSLVRHPSETAEQFRQRVVHAYGWHMLGGKTLGLPELLNFYGLDALRIDNLRQWVPSRWAEFQVGLNTPTTQAEQTALLADLGTLIWLINEYKPARSVLARIYTDTYDVYPTVWSDGTAWSEGFWSRFSGVEIPGSDGQPGLIVSFGMPYRVQSEQYALGGAGLGIESRYGVLIPYVDRPMWSRSRWGELYPMNSGFTIGELLSLHWCEKIVSSSPWTGSWDSHCWVEKITWDRILPEWSMAVQSWCKSQAVHSWPGMACASGRDGTYGDINACYSVPTVVVSGTPPRWGAFAYSEEDPAREVLRILERFQQTSSHAAAPLASDNPGCVVGLEAVYSVLAPYVDHATWSRSPWSESYPRGHGFSGSSLLSLHFCERVLADQGWDGTWDSRIWSKTTGWDRILPEWSMAVQSWCKAQAVHSWPGMACAAGRDGTYGDINACYSVPTVIVSGTPPRWGAFAYSEEDPAREVLRITERYQDVLVMGIPAVQPACPGFAPGQTLSAATAPLRDQTWSGTWEEARRWWDYTAQTAFSVGTMNDALHDILHRQACGVTCLPDDIWRIA